MFQQKYNKKQRLPEFSFAVFPVKVSNSINFSKIYRFRFLAKLNIPRRRSRTQYIKQTLVHTCQTSTRRFNLDISQK